MLTCGIALSTVAQLGSANGRLKMDVTGLEPVTSTMST